MTVHLQRAVKGAAAADVRWLENISRRVVWVDVDETVRRGALSADASGVIAHAADTAREKGLPLIMTLCSSAADIVEGVAALHGWGLAAKAISKCSCYVPIITVVTGPAVSGPA